MKISMSISTRQPFDFKRTLRFILSPPKLLDRPLLDHFVDGEYRRAAEIDGQPVLYGVSEGGAFAVKVANPRARGSHPRWSTRSVDRAGCRRSGAAPVLHRSRSRTVLSTRLPDPALSRLVTHFRGMRIPQAPAVFETLICAILEQQVNLSFAHQVKEALVKTYGGQVEFEGRTYRVFPEPAALAITTPEELRRLQIRDPKRDISSACRGRRSTAPSTSKPCGDRAQAGT